MSVRYYQKLFFDEFGFLIEQSTLPILISGDNSHSLAIQYEKQFISEVLPNTTDTVSGIHRILKSWIPEIQFIDHTLAYENIPESIKEIKTHLKRNR